MAIDHAFIFSTLSYEQLRADEYHPISNEHLLVSEFGHIIKRGILIDEAFLSNEEKYFYLCIERCKNNFTLFARELQKHYPSLNNADMTQVEILLFDKQRNKQVFEEYIIRLRQ